MSSTTDDMTSEHTAEQVAHWTPEHERDYARLKAAEAKRERSKKNAEAHRQALDRRVW